MLDYFFGICFYIFNYRLVISKKQEALKAIELNPNLLKAHGLNPDLLKACKNGDFVLNKIK